MATKKAITHTKTTHVSEGCRLISEVRADQLGKWSPEHDDTEHPDGELAAVAARVLCPDVTNISVPGWGEDLANQLANRLQYTRVRALQAAGALVAAEIDRLLRQEGRAS